MFLLKPDSELQNLFKKPAVQYENINKLQTAIPRSGMHSPSQIFCKSAFVIVESYIFVGMYFLKSFAHRGPVSADSPGKLYLLFILLESIFLENTIIFSRILNVYSKKRN